MTLFLLVLSFVLLLLAGLGVGHPRVQLGWLGAAAFVLIPLLAEVGVHG